MTHQSNNGIESGDGILDFSGRFTGIAFDRKLIVSLIGTLLLYFGLSFLPREAYGPNCAKSPGFIAATIFWMVTTPIQMAVSGMLIAALSTMTGILQWSDVTSQLSSSPFYTLLGMSVVANGMQFTPVGRRLAYWLLYRFGKKPVRLMLVVGVFTACLSSVVSNYAMIILMSGIASGLLLAMGEVPGKSKYGQAMILMVTMASLVGGMALINGAVGNLNGIAFLNAASGDLNLTIAYAEWAKLSLPIFAITIVPTIYIYIKVCGIRGKDYASPEPSYFKQQIEDMGKVGGSEIRWVLICAGMVISMLMGVPTAKAAVIFASLCMLPGVGICDCKQVLKNLPWNVLICVCTVPLIGTMMSKTGLSDWINDIIRPLVGNMKVLPFSIACCTITFLCMNLMINCTQGAQAITITLATSVCIGLGYNPCTVLMPTLFAGAWTFCMGQNFMIMFSYDYGWWKVKDATLPGFITGFFLCIAVPILNYILVPLWGMSYYL